MTSGLGPVPNVGGHTLERDVVDRMPVLVCQVCDLIWWPDQRAPKQTCSQRQASEKRRKTRSVR